MTISEISSRDPKKSTKRTKNEKSGSWVPPQGPFYTHTVKACPFWRFWGSKNPDFGVEKVEKSRFWGVPKKVAKRVKNDTFLQNFLFGSFYRGLR